MARQRRLKPNEAEPSRAFKKRAGKARLSRSEAYLANIKYMGEEPEFLVGETLNDNQLGRTLNWYAGVAERKDIRAYLETYLKEHKRFGDLQSLKEVPDPWLPQTAAWIARVMSRGAEVSTRTYEFFQRSLTDCFKHAGRSADDDGIEKPTEKRKPVEHARLSIQDAMQAKVSDFIAGIELAIDAEGWADSISIYDELKKADFPPMLASRVGAYYAPVAEEAALLITARCPEDLLEGYRHYTKSQLAARSAFYKRLVSETDRYAGNKRALKETAAPKQRVKRQRKVKVQAPDKKLKNFVYERENAEKKLASVSPMKIVGAQQLFVLNTKYNNLTVFNAIDRGGLDIHRSSITKYNEETSFSIKVGRKWESITKLVLEGKLKAFEKAVADITRKPEIKQRVNENTIILKVV